MKRINKDLTNFPLQPKPCKTCPFAGEYPIGLRPKRYAELYQNIVNFEGQQFCHSVDNKSICRGGRDLQIKIAYAHGWIGEMTNEAFEKAIKECINK